MSQTALKSPFEPVVAVPETPVQDPVIESVKKIRKFQEMIQRAVAAGDMEALQRFTQEMNAEVARAGTLSPPAKPPLAIVPDVRPDQAALLKPAGVNPAEGAQPPRASSGMYDSSRCSVDLDQLVYDGDRDVLASVLLDPVVLDAIERDTARRKASQGPSVRSDLLKRCLHLTPRLAPRLHALLQDCGKVLGLKAAAELYIEDSPHRNAWVFSPDGVDKLYIVMTSGLVESLEEDELRFILGHEIGHHLFDHRRVPVLQLLEHQGGAISPIKRMKLFAWKRNAEISCDRIGLLCARSHEASLRALFKLSSGIHKRLDGFDIGEYAQQFLELQKEVEGGVADPNDWYSTHPFNPVRIQAMQYFHRSTTYRDLSGDLNSPGDISEPDLEKRIHSLLKVMEPVALQEEGASAEVFREFLLWAGLDLASLDGVLSQEEIGVLASLVPTPPPLEQIQAFIRTPHADRWKKVMEVGNAACVHASMLARMNLLRDLCVLAASDRKVDDAELEILIVHARAMGVGDEHIHRVLEDLKRPLD